MARSQERRVAAVRSQERRVAAVPSPAREVAPDGGTRNAPVIVLTYGNAGGNRLQALLESQPELTCTVGTGILPACEQAATAWKQAERRPARPLSPMALKSIRAMTAQLITIVTVRTGRPRWCELATAEPSAAAVFGEIFPEARFLCLHRSCPDLISAVLLASPWGLSGPGYAPYVAAYPGSTVAALAAWWTARARPLLDFEKRHPGQCQRLHYAGLDQDPDATVDRIRAFLGLGGPAALPAEPPAAPDQAPAPPNGPAGPGLAAGLPVDQIPPPLLAQVNDLHTALGYQPIGPDDAG
jgi:hypothetical protein